MTNRHVHANMIIAKAENMNLVLFYLDEEDEQWRECSFEMMINPDVPTEFFLCLPKHQDAVLNILNGGESQANYGEVWGRCNCSNPTKWSKVWWYMNEDCESRIKPQKQKRLIATFPWDGNAFYVTPESFASEELLNDYVDIHYGKRDLMLVHEIEVEV